MKKWVVGSEKNKRKAVIAKKSFKKTALIIMVVTKNFQKKVKKSLVE